MGIGFSLPTRTSQVVVAGGGTAGWVAALAAARNGAQVLVIERRHHLGGNLSSGLPVLGFFNVQSQQIVRGIAGKFVERLLPLGGTDGYQLFDLWQTSHVTLEPLVVKSLIYEMLAEAGVDILFASQVTDVVTEGERIAGVVIQKKSGRELVLADLFIDATGDAELAQQAGAAVQVGGEGTGAMQPPTLLVRMFGVDMRALRDHLKRNPEDYVSWRMKPGKHITPEFLETVPMFLAFPRQLQEARENGDYEATIDRVMFSVTPFERSIIVNMLRPYDVDGTQSEGITRGLDRVRPEVLKLEAFFRKYIPGCKDAFATDADPELLLRETRRIRGDYILTADDVLEGRQFTDSIALGGYYIDFHNPGDAGCDCTLSEGTYGIPYRCLLPKGIENLLAVGRTISGTQTAAGSFRVMATCMAMGQAGGTAAAISTTSNTSLRKLDTDMLRERLVKQAALVDWPPQQ